MLGQTVYELLVKISGDASGLKSAIGKAVGDLDGLSTKLTTIGTAMSGIGLGIVGGLGATVKKTADAGSAFDDMSKRTGVSVEELSALSYVADQTGTDIGTVENSLRYLAQAIGDASNGVGTGKDAFEKLGIAVTDTEGNLRPTVDVMKDAATALSNMTNETEKIALSTDMFGTGYGTKLLPMLKEGGDGIDELMQKAADLNFTFTTEAATAAAEFNDRMSELQLSLESAGRAIGDTLIPAIAPLVEQITTVVVHVSEWIEKNPKLVEIIGEIGVVLAVGGPVLVGIGMLIKAIQAIGSIGAVTTPIGALAVAIGAIIVIWKNWDEIVEYVEGFVSKIKDFFSDLMDFVQGIVQKIEDFITGLIDKIKTAITDLKDMLKISSGDTAVSSGGMGAGGVRKLIEQHETGIDYVPQTGLALIHEGEAVLNKMDAESYRKGNMGMSYNPIVNITVQGDGDESKIRRAVEQALNESARQFRRTGYELIPGMG